MRRLLGLRLRALLNRESREDGVAMAMVVGVAAVMMLLVATMSASSVSGLVKSTHDEDWNGAIDAAYAGVADYQGRLANDYTYVQYGNPDSTYGSGNPDRAISLPPVTNDAFGLKKGGTWATVAGSGGAASYRYEVDNSDYSSTGVLRIRATGRVGTTTRSVVADLKQQGFIDYLYFTDYEINRPPLAGNVCGDHDDPPHAWEGRSASCDSIQFIAGDVINGPMHSNDTIVICGGKFTGTVTTSSTILVGTNRYSTTGCNPVNTPNFVAGKPALAPTISMPAGNQKLSQETRTDLPLVQRPGCLYTGPTSITFNGATMTVYSPWTKQTQVSGDPVSAGTHPTMCGTPGDPTKSAADNKNTLAAVGGITIPVLDQNLIYVQDVPSVSTDPNYWGTTYPNKLTAAKYCVGATGSTGAGNGIGFPVASEVPPVGGSTATSDPETTASYGCKSGDVFVKGTFDAALTIGSQRYVYVTGDLKRKDIQSDILGLIGNNIVWVWNPVDSDDDPILTDTGRQIDAAILSAYDSFSVQNYDSNGTRGQLTVNGSIAQKFRGTVGMSSNGKSVSGYTKNYVYDPRLRNIAPPRFLEPTSTSYGINMLVEVKSAFTSDGTAVP